MLPGILGHSVIEVESRLGHATYPRIAGSSLAHRQCHTPVEREVNLAGISNAHVGAMPGARPQYNRCVGCSKAFALVKRQYPWPLNEHLGNGGKLALNQFELQPRTCQVIDHVCRHFQYDLLAAPRPNRDADAAKSFGDLPAELPHPRHSKILQGRPPGDILSHLIRYGPYLLIDQCADRGHGPGLQRAEDVLGLVGFGAIRKPYYVEVL